MSGRIIDVTAAIIRHGDAVLIAKRGAEKHLAGKWEFPGGKIEEGEDAATCLPRELREELGVTVSVGEPFHTVLHDYGEYGIVRLHSYCCTLLTGEPAAHAHAELRWVELQDLSVYDFAPADRPIVERLISQSGEAT